MWSVVNAQSTIDSALTISQDTNKLEVKNDSTTIYLQFEISKKGKIENITYLRKEGNSIPENELQGLISEATRILKETEGKWGKKRKRVRYVLPIKFAFTDAE